MSDVFAHGRFVDDPWRLLGSEDAVPADGQVLLSTSQFLAAVAGLPAEAQVGVKLEAGDRLDDIVPHLDRIALIAISFPKFADGRGFSMARLLRERHGYAGPIRAVGDVLLDLIPMMERVGFTEFTVTHEPTRRALLAGHNPAVPYFYQPGWAGDASTYPVALGRPWLRRAV